MSAEVKNGIDLPDDCCPGSRRSCHLNWIKLQIQKHDAINKAIEIHKAYIASETLCADLQLVDEIQSDNKKLVELDEIQTYMAVQKM